ncbi:hypothetical protein Tco_0555586 [Tanacetum coccineum]
MHRSTPRAYMTPTLTASLQGKNRKQCGIESSSPRQSHKITIKRKKLSTNLIPPPSDDKDRDEIAEATLLSDKDEESYASEFADLVLNDDVDDFGTRLEPESHKENPENVDDDDIEIEKENKEDEEIEKEKKDVVDIEKENKDKEIEKEKNDDNIREVLDHCNKVVPDVTFAKTKEMITQEMSRLVNLAVNKDREVDPINAKEMIAKEFATHGPKMIEELFRKHMQNTTLNLYPTTSSSTARKSTADLQHQLYLNMKSNPQD